MGAPTSGTAPPGTASTHRPRWSRPPLTVRTRYVALVHHGLDDPLLPRVLLEAATPPADLHVLLTVRSAERDLDALAASEHLPLRDGEPPAMTVARQRLTLLLDRLAASELAVTGEVTNDPHLWRALRAYTTRHPVDTIVVPLPASFARRQRTYALARRIHRVTGVPVHHPELSRAS